MTCDVVALCVEANDRCGWRVSGPPSWVGAIDEPGDGVSLLPGDDTGFGLRFLPTQAPKTGLNRMHLDLTSTSLQNQQETVARVLAPVAATSTSVSCPRRSTWCSRTRRATSSA